MTLLHVRDLSVARGPNRILDRITATVKAGEVVGVLGPNGVGKTTLLASILGLVPSTGTIELMGRPAGLIPARERARLVSYLPQARDAAWPMTAEMIVALGRLPHSPGLHAPTRADRDAVDRAMQATGVTHLRTRPISQLSGGEKTRVLLARTLAQDAALIVADEPASGLDPAQQITILRLFRELAASGRSVLLSLHELHLAAMWCDRLLLLSHGVIAAEGAPAEVLTAERIAEVYGCDAHVTESPEGLIVVPLARLARR